MASIFTAKTSTVDSQETERAHSAFRNAPTTLTAESEMKNSFSKAAKILGSESLELFADSLKVDLLPTSNLTDCVDRSSHAVGWAAQSSSMRQIRLDGYSIGTFASTIAKLNAITTVLAEHNATESSTPVTQNLQALVEEASALALKGIQTYLTFLDKFGVPGEATAAAGKMIDTVANLRGDATETVTTWRKALRAHSLEESGQQETSSEVSHVELNDTPVARISFVSRVRQIIGAVRDWIASEVILSPESVRASVTTPVHSTSESQGRPVQVVSVVPARAAAESSLDASTAQVKGCLPHEDVALATEEGILIRLAAAPGNFAPPYFPNE